MNDESALTKHRILEELRQNDDVLKRYSVRNIALFGSFASGRQTDSSDIDLFVEFDRPTFDNFLGLSRVLESIFKGKVDILTPDGLRSIRVPEVEDGIRKSMTYCKRPPHSGMASWWGTSELS